MRLNGKSWDAQKRKVDAGRRRKEGKEAERRDVARGGLQGCGRGVQKI